MRLVFAEPMRCPRLAAVLAGMILASCAGDGAGPARASDAGDDGPDAPCPFDLAGRDPGSCLIATRRPTPPELCPGGRFSQAGICLPAPPAFSDCPSGWDLVSRDHNLALLEPAFEPVRYCVPPAPPASCPAGMTAQVGSADCVRQGSECPEGAAWASEAEIRAAAPGFDGRILYVLPGADTEGFGSREAPFASIRAAVVSSRPGGVVALAAGEYAETAGLDGIALVGACVEGTRLSPPSGAPPTVVVGPLGGLLAQLTINSRRPGIAFDRTDADGTLADVAIRAATDFGVFVDRGAGRVTLAGVLVDGVEGGPALEIDRAAVSVQRSAFHGAALSAVLVYGSGAELDATDLLVSDTQSVLDGRYGRGLDAAGGARVVLERTLVTRNRDVAIFALGAGTEVALRDVHLLDHRPRPVDDASGLGIYAGDEATFDAQRVVVERSTRVAIGVVDGAIAQLRDLVVLDTRPQPDGAFGRAIEVDSGASLHLERAALMSNEDVAIFVHDPDTRLTAIDVLVADTGSPLPEPAAGAWEGVGLMLAASATGTVTRLALLRNELVAVLTSDPGTALTASDLIVLHTRPSSQNDGGGLGMAANTGSRLSIERAEVRNNHAAGALVVSRGTELRLTDVLIADTLPHPADDDLGRGVTLEDRATAVVERVELLRNHDVAVFALASTITLSDVIIDTTLPAATGGGTALALALDTRGTLSNFVVANSQLVGILLAGTAEFAASEGLVTGNQIGVNVQAVDFDVTSAFTDVVLDDNALDVDYSELPLPRGLDLESLVGD